MSIERRVAHTAKRNLVSVGKAKIIASVILTYKKQFKQGNFNMLLKTSISKANRKGISKGNLKMSFQKMFRKVI
jgi:transcriptional/translational regulatory protein YebC/TACO1